MDSWIGWVGSIQQSLDSWACERRDMVSITLPRWQWGWRWQWQWPWKSDRERKETLDEEYKRRKEQIQTLCNSLKAEDVTDLKDILSAMILSECVYKRPASEVLRCVKQISDDFGGQLVQLDCVQPSLDHVPHRYLLAESGDTLFASFIGTKQYKDMITDANILQGTVFHEDIHVEGLQAQADEGNGQVILKLGSEVSTMKPKKSKQKPAAHRGFLARANGIPAVELYRLAKKKDRRLVLCGHSLGGAVAVLATLAILRVLAATSNNTKKDKSVEVKCITFSQPPVGNGALRDYVHEKGWHGHFRTYCIPEDLIPRILSPAYFQHYRMQAQPQGSGIDPFFSISQSDELAESADSKSDGNLGSNSEERSSPLNLGVLQNSLRKISALVPLVSGPKSFNQLSNKTLDVNDSQSSKWHPESSRDDPSFNIQEITKSGSLISVSEGTDDRSTSNGLEKVSYSMPGNSPSDWRQRVPSLPSYVPFGQLFLLEKSSVEPLSASEYTLLTSMQSVLLELKDRFRSHVMRSYRSRFQRIYDICMCDNVPPNDCRPYLSHFQQWLGLPGMTITELGRIAEPLELCSATSLIPIGWTGIPGEKKKSPFRVDVCGYGLHLCTLVKAQINGQWCKAIVESSPEASELPEELQKTERKLQKMRIRIGKPIKEPSTIPEAANAEHKIIDREYEQSIPFIDHSISTTFETRNSEEENITEVIIHCSSDFVTVSKKVVMRPRRVRLLGLEGAGKTSLYYALLGQSWATMFNTSDGLFPDVNRREGVAEGVAFVDPAGVNLQDLSGEVDQLRQEVSPKEGSKKVDLIILVHNLAHKIPRLHQSEKPALSVLLDEVASARIPRIIAITNKFAVSAEQRQSASASVIRTYQIPSDLSVIVNSSPYVLHQHRVGGDNSSITQDKLGVDVVERRMANLNRLIAAPISLIQLPFRRKDMVLPIEGVKNLRDLVNRVLLEHEDATLREFCKEKLLEAMKDDLLRATAHQTKHGKGALTPTATASAVGASLGLLVAVVVAATASLRKP